MTASGFSSRCLRARSAPPRPRCGVAGEVPAAEALHGDDEAAGERRRGRGDRVHRPHGLTGGGEEAEPRPTGRAGVRLRVEAPVARALVLAPAGGAHAEVRHRGRGPVVGHVGRDREAGAAVGAVGEGVAVAPVGRVGHLGQALVAGGEVGRDREAARTRDLARDDHEPARRLGRDRAPVEALDGRPRRGARGERGHEGVEGALGGERLDGDAEGIVPHAAGDPPRARDAVDPGAEAHPLHGAPDLDPPPGEAHGRATART
jgi:hypothetical protein